MREQSMDCIVENHDGEIRCDVTFERPGSNIEAKLNNSNDLYLIGKEHLV